MISNLYGKFLVALATKQHDLSSDEIYGMLCTSTYSPDQDTDDFKDDITNEVSGDGYDAGGKEITSISITYNSTEKQMEMAADDLQWDSSTISNARYLVIYNNSTGETAGTKALIGYVNFESDKSSDNSTFKIELTDGILFKLSTNAPSA